MLFAGRIFSADALRGLRRPSHKTQCNTETVTLSTCGELRCLACGQRDRWSASCKDYALSLQLATRRLEVHVRKCPQCFEFWEKPYGCVHLWMMEKICSRCKAKFCWHCGNEGLTHFRCAELPLETKVLYTSGLFCLSSKRLNAIKVGLKKLTALIPTLLV